MFVGCLTSQQRASVPQGRICSDNFTCCHTEIKLQTKHFYLTHSQYTDTGPTSPSADPLTPGAWQGSHWSANFEVTDMTRPGKIPSQAGFEPRIFRSRGGRLNHWAKEAVWTGERLSSVSLTLNILYHTTPHNTTPHHTTPHHTTHTPHHTTQHHTTPHHTTPHHTKL